MVAMTQDEPHGWIVPPHESLCAITEVSDALERSLCAERRALESKYTDEWDSEFRYIPKEQKDKTSKEKDYPSNIDIFDLVPFRSLPTVQLVEVRWMVEDEV